MISTMIMGTMIAGAAALCFILDNDSDSTTKKENNETYEYFMTLSYDEQKDYFKSNLDLRDYYDTHYYKNDRHLTAKHAQEIANKLGKQFTNINKRY